MSLDGQTPQPYPFPRTADAVASTDHAPAVSPFNASQIAAAASAAAGTGAPRSAPDAINQLDAAAALDAFAAVNLDEVSVGTITVPFVDWVEQPLPPDAPEGAEPALVPVVRKVTLTSFVPMFVFNQSLALFSEMAQSGGDQKKNMELIAAAVLMVWQLSDPKMTLQRLLMGLDFLVIMRLFNDFFAAKLRLIGLRVGPAATLSGARG